MGMTELLKDAQSFFFSFSEKKMLQSLGMKYFDRTKKF